MKLAGAAAIVTGGGSGLGKATAEANAAKGARVAVLDRNAGAAEAVAKAIGGLALAADVADSASAESALARELAQFGVRGNSIAPGLFLTPMLLGLPQEAQDSFGRAVPFPARLGDPAEFAALAVHIVENAYLNGETIRIDGALRLVPR